MNRLKWLSITLLLFAAPQVLAEGAPPCSYKLDGGAVIVTPQLSPTFPLKQETQSCLEFISKSLAAENDLRSLTVVVKLADKVKDKSIGLKVASAMATVFIDAGIPKRRISFVAPTYTEGGESSVGLAVNRRRIRTPIGRLNAARGEVGRGVSIEELQPALGGSRVFLGDYIRTAKTATATMGLDDGSILRLDGDSTVRLTRFQKDPRGIELDVLDGYVETLVAPGAKIGEFQIRTKAAVAGVRGTIFRVDSRGENTRLETTEGSVALGAMGNEVLVASGFGSRVRVGESPSEPVALLGGPKILPPFFGVLDVASELQWEEDVGASGYRLEIAQDSKFVRQRQVFVLGTNRFRPPAQLRKAGVQKWFWRVSSISTEGFVGFPSKIYSFEISK